MRFSLLVLFTFMLVACQGSQNPNAGQPMRVAPMVELEAYQGLWYEIASIPSVFQAGCTNTSAKYTPDGENRVKVLNRCRLFGGVNSIEGFATAKETDSALLTVNLKVAGLFSTGGAPYWVLAVGPKGANGLYDWAVVGNPSRSFGWILSRAPKMEASIVAKASAILEASGYDMADFRFDPQDQPFTD